MGFGKWIVGGACAVGAVIAAPVVLPAAGFAIAGSSLGATGVGLAASLGMMTASSGAVAATAAAAGAAGVVASTAQEKKLERARCEGRKDGYVAASEAYEDKYRKQEFVFNKKIKECMEKIEQCKEKLEEFKRKEQLTREEMEEKDQLIADILEYIEEIEKESNESGISSPIPQQIVDIKSWVLKI